MQHEAGEVTPVVHINRGFPLVARYPGNQPIEPLYVAIGGLLLSISRQLRSWWQDHKLSFVKGFAKQRIVALSSSSALTATAVSVIAAPLANSLLAVASGVLQAAGINKALKAASIIVIVNAFTASARPKLPRHQLPKA